MQVFAGTSDVKLIKPLEKRLIKKYKKCKPLLCQNDRMGCNNLPCADFYYLYILVNNPLPNNKNTYYRNY
jgi:hypothetical protein